MYGIGPRSHIVMHLETAVDSSPWSPLGWLETVVRGPAASSFVWSSASCSLPMPAAALTLGPHRLDFRATVTYRDAPESETSDRVSRCTTYAPAAERVEPVVAQFTKTLRSLTITIFEQYPGELPEVVNPSALADSIDSWFKPERFRVVQARLPEGTGSALVVSDTRWGPLMGPVCRAGGTARGLLMGVELSGNFSITPEIPIAAIAEWRSQSGEEAILSFPIINGGGFFRLGEQLRFGQGATFAAISDQEQPLQSFAVDRPHVTSGFLKRAGSPGLVLAWLGSAIPYGFTRCCRKCPCRACSTCAPPATLHWPASSASTLGNVSRPVLLDVLTLESRWVDDPRCTTARHNVSQSVAQTS